MDMNKFGERLSGYRKNKNITQEEFAARMGVSAQAVSKWERGQSLPDISLIHDIGDILGVDANEILNVTSMSRITENDDIVEQKRLLSGLCAEPIKIIFGRNIVPIFIEGLKTKLISEKRIEIARESGILIPIIHALDEDQINDNEFRIISYDKVLYSEDLAVIEDATFESLIDKLFEISVINYSDIINKQIVKILIDNLKTTYPGVADEVIPEKISYLFVLKVLKSLLIKQISIHNLIKIIEIMEEEVLSNCTTDVEDIVSKIIVSI